MRDFINSLGVWGGVYIVLALILLLPVIIGTAWIIWAFIRRPLRYYGRYFDATMRAAEYVVDFITLGPKSDPESVCYGCPHVARQHNTFGCHGEVPLDGVGGTRACRCGTVVEKGRWKD